MQTINIENVIIGAGISGCILGKILNDKYLIIERLNSVGGEMNNNILGPKLFHKTPETEEFFKNQIKSVVKIKNITLNNGVINDDKDVYEKKIGYSFSNSKNSSINEFDSFELDLNSFYSSLNIMLGANILKIDLDKKCLYVLHNKKLIKISYNYLISTIDYDLFTKICNIKNDYDLVRRGVVYVNMGAKYKEKFSYLKNYNFWYNLTEEEFFRCTNFEDRVTIEVFIENCENLQLQLNKYFQNIADFKYYYNPNAKIWNKSKQQIVYNLLKDKNVYLLGRNAMYNHDRIQDSIVKSYLILKEINEETHE